MFLLGTRKVLGILEGMKFDMQQIMKQNLNLAAQVERLIDCRPMVDDLDIQFDFELPIKNDDSFDEMEHKLLNRDDLKSLVFIFRFRSYACNSVLTA